MVATDPAAQKRTAIGLTGVDQKELQRAIAAARAAAASGEAPKPAASTKRTMMGVAAVKTPAVAKPAQGSPVDDGWGAADVGTIPAVGTKTPLPGDPDLDGGWDVPETPVMSPVRKRFEAPTAPSTPQAKATAIMESMANVPVRMMPTAPKPTGSKPTERTTDPGPGPALLTRPVGVGGAPVVGPRSTVEMGSMAAVPAKPSIAPPTASAPGIRATAVLGAMAAPLTTPATKPSGAAGAPVAASPAAKTIAMTAREQLADTLAGDRSTEEVLAARDDTPAVPIAASSTDPLADTISPGSMRIDEILRGMGAESGGPGVAAPPPTSPPRAQASPGTSTGPHPAASPTTTTGTGIRKAATTTHPPFLASKALAEDMHPTEPGRGEMRVIAIAGAIALGALWAAPLSLDPLAFEWNAAARLSGTARLLAYYTPIAALVLLILGALRVPYRVRAVGALTIGLIPLILAVGGLGPAPAVRGWPGAVLTIAMVMLPGALVHRANYRGSTLARSLVALGVLLTLAWMFVPGGANFVGNAVAGLRSAHALPEAIVMAGALLLVASSLLAFMPSSTTAGTSFIGHLLLLVRPALLVTAAVAQGTAGQEPMPLAVSTGVLLVYGVLASIGMAQALASLERRAV